MPFVSDSQATPYLQENLEIWRFEKLQILVFFKDKRNVFIYVQYMFKALNLEINHVVKAFSSEKHDLGKEAELQISE